MSDTLTRIHALSDRQALLYYDIGRTHNAMLVAEMRKELRQINAELDALWAARRRELAGTDFAYSDGIGRRRTSGVINGRLPRWSKKGKTL
jgi:hypothetical protein